MFERGVPAENVIAMFDAGAESGISTQLAAMTGAERFLAALRVEQPDTVPTFTKGMSPQAILSVARELKSGVPDIAVDLMSPIREEDSVSLMELYMFIHEELDIDGYTNRDVGLLYSGELVSPVNVERLLTTYMSAIAGGRCISAARTASRFP